MSGIVTPGDIAAEGVAQAIQLAGDELRLTTAPYDQLTAAASFLARALAQFGEGAGRNARKSEAIARLEAASKAIGAELRRRAFT